MNSYIKISFYIQRNKFESRPATYTIRKYQTIYIKERAISASCDWSGRKWSWWITQLSRVCCWQGRREMAMQSPTLAVLYTRRIELYNDVWCFIFSDILSGQVQYSRFILPALLWSSRWKISLVMRDKNLLTICVIRIFTFPNLCTLSCPTIPEISNKRSRCLFTWSTKYFDLWGQHSLLTRVRTKKKTAFFNLHSSKDTGSFNVAISLR